MSCCPFWPSRDRSAERASKSDLGAPVFTAAEIDALERGDWGEMRNIQEARRTARQEESRRILVLGCHILGVGAVIGAILCAVGFYGAGQHDRAMADYHRQHQQEMQDMFCNRAIHYGQEHPDQQIVPPDVMDHCAVIAGISRAEGDARTMEFLSHGVQQFQAGRFGSPGPMGHGGPGPMGPMGPR